jgi:TPR repeat protein
MTVKREDHSCRARTVRRFLIAILIVPPLITWALPEPAKGDDVAQPRSAVPGPAIDAQRLLARGRALSAAGDISGARLVFEYAALDNDPAALHALAETYDPAVLKRWRVLGPQADPEKARSLYEQAALGRMKLAQARLVGVMQSLGNRAVTSKTRSPDQ